MLGGRKMPNLSKLRRASAWLTARLRGLTTAPAHRIPGAAGRGEEQSGLALLPPRQLQPANSASLSCSPSQTSGCVPGALRPLAVGLFRFRPALQSPPISLCIWVSGHLLGRRSRFSVSSRCCLRCCLLLPHLLRQAGGCGGPRGGGGGSDMEPGAGGRSAARGHGARPPSIPPPREQERKLEQEKLSGVVKSVHRRLRKKYREGKQRAERGEGEASSPPAPCQPLPSPQGATITT